MIGAYKLRRAQGFTLIELGIVIVIIGLILTIVMKGDKLFGKANSQAVRAAVKEYNEAIGQFQSTYGYLPGDIPNASSKIPGVNISTNPCILLPAPQPSVDGDGNGQIDATELLCVNVHLFGAGLIKGGNGAISIQTSSSTRTTIRAIARSASTLGASFPSGTRTLIEIWNLPCDIAQEFDEKTDDGNFSTGNVRAPVASCVIGGSNDPVSFIAIGI